MRLLAGAVINAQNAGEGIPASTNVPNAGYPRFEPTRKLVQTFRDKGLKVEFASFPGSHEWQVWRKSLNDFTQKLFK